MSERALVAVESATVDGQRIDGLLVATCSEHGELTEWESPEPTRRHWLQEVAHRHAMDEHDGDVDREGWA